MKSRWIIQGYLSKWKNINISQFLSFRHVRLSFPKDLYDEIVKAHGPKEAEEICRNQDERGMLTVRTNTIKTTRNDVNIIF